MRVDTERIHPRYGRRMKGERKGWKFIYGLKDELTARAEETVIYDLKDVAREEKKAISSMA